MKLWKQMLQLPAQDLTVDYHAAKAQLETLVGCAFDEHYKLEIQFTFMPPRQPTASYVGQLQRFIQSVHEAEEEYRRVFKLSLIHAYVHTLPYTAEMATFFEFVRRGDIQLAMASLGPRLRNTDEQAIDRVVSAMMAVETNPQGSREPPVMVIHGCDVKLFERVCTTLASGTRIDHLVLENAFSDALLDSSQSAVAWGLLGRALSEPLCSRRLRVLSIAAIPALFDHDVKAFRKSLRTPRDTAVQMVTITKGAVLRLPLDGEATVQEPSMTCQVVKNDAPSDRAWMKVKVPGEGTCLVKCADVIDAFEGRGVRVWKPVLESLDIGCVTVDAKAIPRLAKCFATSLRQLNIHVGYDPGIKTHVWASILTECPHLQALSVTNATLKDLSVLYDVYSIGRRNSLTRISLTNTRTTQTSLLRFILTLSNPKHSLARTLLEFRCVSTNIPNLRSSSNQPSPAIVRELAPMLRKNKTLEFLEIGLVPELYKAHELQLRAFHNELLRTGPSGRTYREISLVEITEVDA